jgi:hypothetical protein
MDVTKQEKIRKIHNDFKNKLAGILDRKKSLLYTYRKKMEEAKIKEIRKSLNI